MKKTITFILAASFFFFAGCKKEYFQLDKFAKTKWNPALAFPIINSTLTPYNILTDFDTTNLFIIDPNTGLLALVYTGELFSFKPDQIVTVPDQTFSANYTAPGIGINSGFGTYTYNTTITHNFNTTSGVQIDSVFFKTANLDISVYSDFQHDIDVTISIPSAKKNGVSFSQTVTLQYLSGPNFSIPLDLSGYTFDMTQGGITSNQFDIDVQLTFYDSGNGISGSEQFDLNGSLNTLSFGWVYGDFGQQTVSTDRDSILIKIFKDALGGTVYFVDPKIKMYIDNSFGFPVRISAQTLESQTFAVNPPTTTPIIYNGNSAPFDLVDINAPTSPGQVVTTTLIIDTTNSNVDILMEPTPKYVYHQIQAISNPAGGPSQNFITDQSELKIRTEVELPLVGYASDWKLIDTLDFNFGQDVVNNVESLLLRLIANNGFPVNAKLQMYFLDSLNNPIDSLVQDRSQNVISSGIVGNDGIVTQPVETITDYTLDKARAQNLVNADKVVVWGEAETPGGSSGEIVKIYDTYQLTLRLSANIVGNITLQQNQ
ncbi:MAG: hypothetical protein D6707_11775 [Bacteroidetes bacterium]|nr:MAG: hypothetical protein D6707_11775 [Bacteroidota bacterium]